jgi:hypothetical protein
MFQTGSIIRMQMSRSKIYNGSRFLPLRLSQLGPGVACTISMRTLGRI